MVTKKELLKNLRNYSPEEIAGAIQCGTITLYELAKESEGAFTPLLKKQVKEILNSPIQEQAVSDKVPIVEKDNQSPESKIDDLSNSDVLKIDPIESNIQEVQTEVQSTSNIEEYTLENKGMFKKPFSFSGRIRRTEYGISFIIYLIWYFVVITISNAPSISQGAAIIVLLSFIPMLWFLWAQNCKRCHDRGNSGWYQLIPFYFIVLLFGDGEPGENEYGSNPKE